MAQSLATATLKDSVKVNDILKRSAELYKHSDYEKAKVLANEALSLSAKINFVSGEGKAHSTLGVINDYQGSYPEALKHHFAALAIREKVGDKAGLSATYNNIGIVYKAQGNFSDALKCYEMSLKLDKEVGNELKLGATLNNIGNIYFYLRRDKEAVSNYLNALEYAKGNEELTANIFNNLGNIYEERKQYDSAAMQFVESARIYKKTGDRAGVAVSSLNIGNSLVKQKKFRKAGEYLLPALKMSLELGEKEYIKGCYEILSQMQEGLGQYHEAYKSYKLYVAYNDSLTNEENTKKTVQMQMQYQFSKQQVADSIRNAERRKQEELKHEQQIKQQKTYTYGGIAGVVLMIVVAGVSFRAYKQKQKDNHIITEQKKLVEEKQKEVLDSIHYARRIQSALITPEKYIKKHLDRLQKT